MLKFKEYHTNARICVKRATYVQEDFESGIQKIGPCCVGPLGQKRAYPADRRRRLAAYPPTDLAFGAVAASLRRASAALLKSQPGGFRRASAGAFLPDAVMYEIMLKTSSARA